MGIELSRAGRAVAAGALVAIGLWCLPALGQTTGGASDDAPSRRLSGKVLPFPEDEQPVPRPTKRLTPPAKSNFKPRFKTPAVRQAQHTEAVGTDESTPAPEKLATPDDEAAAPRDAADAPAVATLPKRAPLETAPPTDGASSPEGRKLVDEAFRKSKAAESDSDYSTVIDLCLRGMQSGLKQDYHDYAKRLMGWAYNRRGEIRAEAGQDAEALVDFETAVDCNPQSWRAVHNRGVSYAAAGRFDDAMADFDHTIELNKNYANAYFNRGELRYRKGDFNGAVRDYTASLQIKPDPVVLNSRGHAYYRLERFGEAIHDYTETLKLDPDNAAAMINRGDTLADLGRYGEASADYRAAVKLDPKLGRAFQSCAWLMATCPDEHYRNEELAVEAARRAVELDGGNDYRDLETLAAAQANAGQFAEAKITQESAIAHSPKGHRVQAEKRMALYQREQPYRETPRTAFQPPEEQPDRGVRKASGTMPLRGRPRRPARPDAQ